MQVTQGFLSSSFPVHSRFADVCETRLRPSQETEVGTFFLVFVLSKAVLLMGPVLFHILPPVVKTHLLKAYSIHIDYHCSPQSKVRETLSCFSTGFRMLGYGVWLFL